MTGLSNTYVSVLSISSTESSSTPIRSPTTSVLSKRMRRTDGLFLSTKYGWISPTNAVGVPSSPISLVGSGIAAAIYV